MTIVSRSVQNRITAAVFSSQALYSAGTIAAFTLTPIIARDLSGNAEFAGLPNTLGQFGRAILAYFVGWLMIKMGRRRSLSFGYLLAAVGAILSIVAILQQEFWIFMLGGLFIGASRGATEQGRYVAAEVYEREQRPQILGIIVFAGTIGAVLGPRMIAPSQNLAESFGLSPATGPYFFTLVVMLLGAIGMSIFLRPDPGMLSEKINIATSTQKERDAKVRSQAELFRLPRVQLAVASMSIGFLVMVLLMVITPLHMDDLGRDSNAISNVITAHTFGMFALSGVTGYLIRKVGQIWMILAGALTLIAASIIAPIASSVFLLGLSLFLLGLGWNFAFVSGSSLLTASVSEAERPRIQGTAESIVAISSMLASFSTGFVYANLGIVVTGILGFIFAALLILAVLMTIPRQANVSTA